MLSFVFIMLEEIGIRITDMLLSDTGFDFELIIFIVRHARAVLLHHTKKKERYSMVQCNVLKSLSHRFDKANA